MGPLMHTSQLEQDWQVFISRVAPCSGSKHGHQLTCLREADAETLSKAQDDFMAAKTAGLLSFIPILDGPNGVFTDSPYKLYSSGHFARLPFITGNNKDEG